MTDDNGLNHKYVTYKEEIEEISDEYVIDLSKDSILQGLIVDLKLQIDKFAEDSKTLEQHILELAKRLDESQACHRNEICQKIKEILKDKIKQGKITERWIEKCLPDDYKRRYDHVKQKQVKKDENKREVSSLLKENESEKREILVAIDGSQHYEDNGYIGKAIQPQPFLNNSGAQDIDRNPSKNNIEKDDNPREDCASCTLLKERINDLEEIIRKNNDIETAYDLQKLELKVPKIWKNVFVVQFKKCKDHIILVVNKKSGTVESLRPDVVSDNAAETSYNRISYIMNNNNDSDQYNATADDNDTLQRGEGVYE